MMTILTIGKRKSRLTFSEQLATMLAQRDFALSQDWKALHQAGLTKLVDNPLSERGGPTQTTWVLDKDKLLEMVTAWRESLLAKTTQK